jgi:branched-chain amino acid transport system ATP-binding protein
VTALLEATGLVGGYRGVAVIRDLDIAVEPGELVALLGPNGAGKTTTLLTLAGELAPLAGSVRCLGLDAGAGLHRRTRAGLALITDRRTVLTGLTIEENARVFRVALDAVLSLFPELAAHRRRQVRLLSGGQQQMLAVGLALARKPPLVLVDELSMGLAPLIVDRLFAVLRTAVDGGAGVLLVEQHVHRAMTIADRVYVLDRGRIRLAGDTSDLRSRVDEIQQSYLAADRPADLRTEAADRWSQAATRTERGRP